MLLKLFKYCFLIIFLSTSLLSKELEKIKLQLQWKHQFEFAGFYIAKEKGFYKEVGIDVEFVEFEKDMNITNEVLSGNVDYGLSFSSLIVDYFNNKPIVMVANFFKQSPLVLVTQDNIKTLADLKGKKVMGLLDSTHKKTIISMLNRFNITQNDFINVKRKFSLEDFISKKVDAISVFTTNEIYTLNKLGIKFNIFDPAVYTTKFYDLNLFTTKAETQNNPERVNNFKEASIKGWQYALENKEEVINLILNKYNTQNRSKEELYFEARQIEHLMLTNIYPIGSINIKHLNMISDDFAQTQFINRGLNRRIEDFVFDYSNREKIKLTQEEKKYLKNKKSLKICIDPNWRPIEMISNGIHQGISSDYIKIVSKFINTPIHLVKTDNWTESLNNIKSGKCDILPLAQKTPERLNYLNFTTPYIDSPLVLVTKKNQIFVANIDKIKNKKIAVVNNYSIQELLQDKYPYIDFIEVNTVKEGLEKVKSNEIFGLLDSLLVANYEIYKNYSKDLIISGQFQENFFLSMASQKNEPELISILEKSLNSITNEQKNKILYKWTILNDRVDLDYKLAFWVLFFSLLIILLFSYWNLKLKKEIKNRKIAEKKLKESELKFRTLFDIAPILLNQFDDNGKIVFWNKECEKKFGYTLDELQKVDNPLSLFYPNPEIRKEVIKSLREKNGLYKEWHPRIKNGKKIITMWSNIELPNNEVINFGIDITKEREYELSLKNKAKELKIVTQKLKALNIHLEERVKEEVEKNTKYQVTIMEQSRRVQMGEMLENIAHQWRQPLAEINSLILLIDFELTRKDYINKELEDKLNNIENITSYLSNTINDFMSFFDVNKKKKKFNLYESIESTLNIIERRLSYHEIKVSINVDKELELFSFSNDLSQVLLIIFNNSIDSFIENKIIIPTISVYLKEKSNNFYLYIEDNAGGIEENIIEKIFDPYFTTKHKSQGTGLGLYISKIIIEKIMNGNLSVKSENNSAIFSIKIPKEHT